MLIKETYPRPAVIFGANIGQHPRPLIVGFIFHNFRDWLLFKKLVFKLIDVVRQKCI